jgi:O-methyltransferase
MKPMNPFKIVGKRLVRHLIYRFPPIFLSPNSLYTWLDILVKTKSLEGDVVEIGCYLGGTAAMSSRMLKNIKSTHDYIVIDTFDGFVEEQFDSEVKLGGARFLQQEFSSNSPTLARWVMNKHGGKDVKMIKGDITKLPDDQIPEKISACLLDIDLADPIYVGLSRIYPRLVSGGIIAVDDCDDETFYKAKIGYERFMKENNFASEIRYGMGIVRKL